VPQLQRDTRPPAFQHRGDQATDVILRRTA
jgi:hypothetical protein